MCHVFYCWLLASLKHNQHPNYHHNHNHITFTFTFIITITITTLMISTVDIKSIESGPKRNASSVELTSTLILRQESCQRIEYLSHENGINEPKVAYVYVRDLELPRNQKLLRVNLHNITWAVQCRTYHDIDAHDIFPYVRNALCKYLIVGYDRATNDMYDVTAYFLSEEHERLLSSCQVYGYNYLRLRRVIGPRALMEPFNDIVFEHFHPDPEIARAFSDGMIKHAQECRRSLDEKESCTELPT